ncbi:acyl-CoA synthetase [Lysobacter ciconiae]|uniref:Long-chain-fatty-acid--CoA ligase n=1 Tax=Novilysobacter ciconiae TaxID=2781022 RepID=A0A7S6ZSI8_9GAMM|nr:AMP-binding protein [Lysobacter ciconiae]QOW19744.1 acyl-CoA synthetase [Lysobacter ciconiae]
MSAVFDNTARNVAAGDPSPLALGAPGREIVFDAHGAVPLSRFLDEVRGVAAGLPSAAYVLNLCEDRYRFLVAFCAAAMRGQTTLLPASRAEATVAQVRGQYPDSYCIVEMDAAKDPGAGFHELPQVLPGRDGEMPLIAAEALVAIGFTSGSTGQPTATPKRWRAFTAGTGQNLAALTGLLGSGAADFTTPVVATVPSQHMYGMEMSVLLPLLGPVAVHVSRPFFPADIAMACSDAGMPPLLVTSPVHLRALLQSGVAMPPLAGIVCSTAPLPPELADAAERRYHCHVRELFGSTETCVIARRRTAVESAWTPLPGVCLAAQPDGTRVRAAHLEHPVVLADVVELQPDGRFVLRGRHADLLEIAGKRASLGDLTRILLDVPGVDDGVIVQLEGDQSGVQRIAAVVVAPGMDEAALMQGLRGRCDPVFLPRRVRFVAQLPRNATGKIPRQSLVDILSG